MICNASERERLHQAMEWFTSTQLAALKLRGLPHTAPGILNMAKREGWLLPEVQGWLWRVRREAGGGKEINFIALPKAAQSDLIRRIRTGSL
jgi:hypothetical protein